MRRASGPGAAAAAVGGCGAAAEAASAAEARMGRGGEEDGGGYLWGSEERDHSSDIGKAQITRSLISLHATRKFLASQNSSFTTAALLRSQT